MPYFFFKWERGREEKKSKKGLVIKISCINVCIMCINSYTLFIIYYTYTLLISCFKCRHHAWNNGYYACRVYIKECERTIIDSLFLFHCMNRHATVGLTCKGGQKILVWGDRLWYYHKFWEIWKTCMHIFIHTYVCVNIS